MATEGYAEALLNRVQLTLVDCPMMTRSSGVVVAVSGGPDSTALLHAMNSLKTRLGFWIVGAHLDHKLRADSSRDAEFVDQLARKLGIKLFLKGVDVRAFASDKHISIEEAGRRARYTFFEEVRQASGAQTIATGHHLDDALETFFLRVFRGSSLQGLRGIELTRGHIIRPLIRLKREEILHYLDEQGIEYRLDPTNLSADTDRNFIRNSVFPLIRERFPGFRKPLERTLHLIDQENKLLDDCASQVSSEAISVSDGIVTINCSTLRTVPLPLAGRAILAALYSLTGPDVRWGSVHVAIIMGILRGSNPSATANLPGSILLQRHYDKIIISHQEEQGFEGTPEVVVTEPGRVLLPWVGATLDLRVVTDRSDLPETLEGMRSAYFDADSVPFPLVVRTFRPGDRFLPWGISGTQKLKKIFIDVKVPRDLRRTWPLLAKEGEILWIPGIRRSRIAPVLTQSSRILEARVSGEKGRFLDFVKL